MALIILGEGTVETRSTHTIRVSFQILDTATGETSRARKTFRVEKTTKAEKTRCKREYRAELESGLRLDTKKITFGQYADEWLAERKASPMLQPRTAERDETRVKNLKLFFGSMTLAEITRADVKRFLMVIQTTDESGKALTLSGKSVCGTTAHDFFVTLKQILQEAVRDKITLENPCADVKAPTKDTEEKTPLSAQEASAFRALLDAGTPRPTLVALRLCLFAGLRRSEAVAVRWSDYNAEAGTIKIERAFDATTRTFKPPKTKAGFRVIPLDSDTISYLERFRAQQAAKYLQAGLPMKDACICSEVGSAYMHPENLTRACKRFGKAYNFSKITPHLLRHTFCTLLFAAGADLKTAQYLMGHDDPQTTLRIYAHYCEANGAKAASAVNSLMESLPSSNVLMLETPKGRYGIKAVAV